MVIIVIVVVIVVIANWKEEDNEENWYSVTWYAIVEWNIVVVDTQEPKRSYRGRY